MLETRISKRSVLIRALWPGLYCHWGAEPCANECGERCLDSTRSFPSSCRRVPSQVCEKDVTDFGFFCARCATEWHSPGWYRKTPRLGGFGCWLTTWWLGGLGFDNYHCKKVTPGILFIIQPVYFYSSAADVCQCLSTGELGAKLYRLVGVKLG